MHRFSQNCQVLWGRSHNVALHYCWTRLTIGPNHPRRKLCMWSTHDVLRDSSLTRFANPRREQNLSTINVVELSSSDWPPMCPLNRDGCCRFCRTSSPTTCLPNLTGVLSLNPADCCRRFDSRISSFCNRLPFSADIVDIDISNARKQTSEIDKGTCDWKSTELIDLCVLHLSRFSNNAN